MTNPTDGLAYREPDWPWPGKRFEIDGEEFEVLEYLDEPDNGLVKIKSRGYGFTMPCKILGAALLFAELEKSES